MNNWIHSFLLIIILFLPFIITQTDNDDFSSSSNDKSSQKNINLPLGDWSINELNITEKTLICDQQKSYCMNVCNQVTNLNFCDINTLKWGCTCQNKLPDSLPFQWPVVIAECNGKEKTCEAGCNGLTDGLCKQSCMSYFKCNRPGGGVPSNLRSDQLISLAVSTRD
ncbi:unnamed protein product [Cunninghamella echinulata]